MPHLGCTGSIPSTDEEWMEIEEVSIPQWGGMHDVMIIYKRRKKRPIIDI